MNYKPGPIDLIIWLLILNVSAVMGFMLGQDSKGTADISMLDKEKAFVKAELNEPECDFVIGPLPESPPESDIFITPYYDIELVLATEFGKCQISYDPNTNTITSTRSCNETMKLLILSVPLFPGWEDRYEKLWDANEPYFVEFGKENK